MKPAALKICGLQSVEVLKSMINLPIDYIGFVFAKSRRRVEPEQAAELVQVLDRWEDRRPSAVGVFVNPDMNTLEETLRKVDLDVVQLHGQETPQFCREVKERFPVSVFKAMPVQGNVPVATIRADLDQYAGSIDALLLDTYDPEYGGGSGRSFVWNVIPLYREWTARHNIPLFVAGGLDPLNVSQLIRDYVPDGVDVSSGVESAPGTKDIVKVTAFVERVKNG